MAVDFKQVMHLARQYEPEMSAFLRDMAAIPSESRNEKGIIQRIHAEMERVGFDRIDIDPMGNILGYIGTGSRLVAMDAHVDTVGPGNLENWTHDPYTGHQDNDFIYGLGTCDQAAGMAAMVYAGKIIKEMDLAGDCTVLVTGTVQEEVCDGLCWRYIIEESGIRPDFVVCTEPSSGKIRLGQKGRMEIEIRTAGKSAHASAPDQGDNAIFKMARIVSELETLAGRLRQDPGLGNGTLTVSEIFFTSPSRCAVADGCRISVDRRLTRGETVDMALDEIRHLPAVQDARAEVSLYHYDAPSYTGLVYPTACDFPAWSLAEDHQVCQTLKQAYTGLFNKAPELGNWAFSTNGTAIMGRHNIPCIGFGPGRINQAHTPDERVARQDMIDAAAMYAVIPKTYTNGLTSLS